MAANAVDREDAMLTALVVATADQRRYAKPPSTVGVAGVTP
jgi:hypothetical protein